MNLIANDRVDKGDGARGNGMTDVEFEYVGLGLGPGREEEEVEAKKGEVGRLLSHTCLPISTAHYRNIILTTYVSPSAHPSAPPSSRPRTLPRFPPMSS